MPYLRTTYWEKVQSLRTLMMEWTSKWKISQFNFRLKTFFPYSRNDSSGWMDLSSHTANHNQPRGESGESNQTETPMSLGLMPASPPNTATCLGPTTIQSRPVWKHSSVMGVEGMGQLETHLLNGWLWGHALFADGEAEGVLHIHLQVRASDAQHRPTGAQPQGRAVGQALEDRGGHHLENTRGH